MKEMSIHMRFSFCVIGKNVAHSIRRCLYPLSRTGLEVVYVDTGSTDDSVKIASEYTDKIFHFDWIEDYSAARNFAMEQCSEDMVFFVDSDEYLELPGETLPDAESFPPEAFATVPEKTDLNKTLELMNKYPHAIGRMLRRNICMSGDRYTMLDDRVERLFDRRQIVYEGIIHEQPVRRDGKQPEAYPVPMVFLHDGYILSPEKNAAKTKERIELLERQLENDKQNGTDDPYTYFQLGKTYGLADDMQKSLECYRKAMSLNPDPSLEYVRQLIVSYGNKAIDTGHYAEALELSRFSDHLSDLADYSCMLGYAALNSGQNETAMHFYKKALTAEDNLLETAKTSLPLHNIGCIYDAYGNTSKALSCFEKAAAAGNQASAERAKRCQEKLNEPAKKFHSLILICSDSDSDSSIKNSLQSVESQFCGMEHIELGIFFTGDTKSPSGNTCMAFEKKYEDNVIFMCNETALEGNALVNEAGASLQPYFTAPGCTVMRPGQLIHESAISSPY